MKVLHLTLKKKWFDMIASGEKKEEYREIKPFWISRLIGADEKPLPFTDVMFYYGYKKDRPSMRFEIVSISEGYGRHKWGAETFTHGDVIRSKKYFVIKLGDRIA